MASVPASLTPVADSNAFFGSTQWGLIVATRLQQDDPERAQDALGALCMVYWPPLYAFARRRGRSPADAKDAVQGFLLKLIADRALARADPALGRFRSYLQTSFQRYLIGEWERASALKRGGGAPHLSLDVESVEAGGLPELATAVSPERAFEERWARTVWGRALTALSEQAQARGKAIAFAALRPFLTEEGNADAYAAAGAGLGLSAATVKTTVHRLRRDFGEVLRREIQHTVADPAEIEDELQYLRSILAQILP